MRIDGFSEMFALKEETLDEWRLGEMRGRFTLEEQER